MRTLAAWVVGLALTGSSIACTSATYGLGDSEDGVEPADSLGTDEFGDEDATEFGDEDPSEGEGDPGDGDGEPMQTCMDPPAHVGVEIKLHGESLPVEDCDEPKFSGRITDAEGGKYSLSACACEDPECDGEQLELDITLPNPEWLPQLDPGTCYFFHLYTEELEPGVCRRNRVDISIDDHEAPWYSAGSASEDLSHNGLTIAPIVADACTDACGEWQVRDITFVAQDNEQTLAWGEDAWVGAYKVVNWQSYATPSGCGTPGVDVTSWTAK
ncbi:MAG: hypothetical protein R6X02_28630 [Enhygromyxa sp.]